MRRLSKGFDHAFDCRTAAAGADKSDEITLLRIKETQTGRVFLTAFAFVVIAYGLERKHGFYFVTAMLTKVGVLIAAHAFGVEEKLFVGEENKPDGPLRLMLMKQPGQFKHGSHTAAVIIGAGTILDRVIVRP